MVSAPQNYKWSSFLDYVNVEKDSICKKEIILEQFSNPISYLEYFNNYDKNSKNKDELFLNQELLIDWEE